LAVVSALISNFFKRLEVRPIDLQLAPAHRPVPQLWPLPGKEKAQGCLDKRCGTGRSGCFILRMGLLKNNQLCEGLWAALGLELRSCAYQQHLVPRVWPRNTTTWSRVTEQPFECPNTAALGAHMKRAQQRRSVLLMLLGTLVFRRAGNKDGCVLCVSYTRASLRALE